MLIPVMGLVAVRTHKPASDSQTNSHSKGLSQCLDDFATFSTEKNVRVRIWLHAHGSGSILDLFSFGSDSYRSGVDATDMDPDPK